MQLSIWEKESFYAPPDILIAGSGFAGLWTAHHLKKKNPGLSITIVDQSPTPIGASTRNAGFACFGSPTELLKDAEAIGVDKMLSLVEMRYRGLLCIREVFKRKQIDYDNCGGYELITSQNEDNYKSLIADVAELNDLLHPILKTKRTFRFENKKIKGFGFADVRHLIHTKLEGSLHPGKLCRSLIQELQKQGVTILTSSQIVHFSEVSGGVDVFLKNDILIRAGKLVICTNAFAKQLLPDVDILPARGQVLVTAPLPSLPFKGTFHFDEGYNYFRNVGNRILLGGARNAAIEEETTTEMTISNNIQSKLEYFLSNFIIPGMPYEISDRWSGIMGFSSEKTPLISKISANVFCLLGMSGMGVAIAPIAGEQTANLVI